RQQKLSGLYLHKDVDYRTVLIEIEDKYSEEELPEKEHLAEEVVLQYCHLVIKALITDLSDYAKPIKKKTLKKTTNLIAVKSKTKNPTSLTSTKQKELKKLVSAYQQVGISLT
ncbi:14066_t:CDS:2, partial [Funneliformis geosporum]